MPTNLYGPGDNFDLTSSHVVPALMRKAHEVKRSGEKTLDVWGSGRPMREFLHVDDAADALVWLLKDYAGDSHVNVGSGEDISIADLARTMLSVVGVEAGIAFDATKPDGTPRKLMDVSRLFATGWRPRYSLRRGLEQTYAWFLGHVDKGDVRLGTA
jgi:GDP-L-fucose synthase